MIFVLCNQIKLLPIPNKGPSIKDVRWKGGGVCQCGRPRTGSAIDRPDVHKRFSLRFGSTYWSSMDGRRGGLPFPCWTMGGRGEGVSKKSVFARESFMDDL